MADEVVLWEMRVSFDVAIDVAVATANVVTKWEFLKQDFPTYTATVRLHFQAPATMPGSTVVAVVRSAITTHVMPLMSLGTIGRYLEARVIWPSSDGRFASSSGWDIAGGAFEQPLPGVLVMPWRLVLPSSRVRQWGKVHWPGMSVDRIDLVALTATDALVQELADAATGLEVTTSDQHIYWVVPGPRVLGNPYKPVVGVQISRTVRAMQRRKKTKERTGTVGGHLLPFPGGS